MPPLAILEMDAIAFDASWAFPPDFPPDSRLTIPHPITFWLVLSSAVLGTTATASARIEIDRDPAPPPDQGPPLSRHAVRDRSLLGAEVGAIVGAYGLFLLLLGTFLAVVGRRLRAHALRTQLPQDLEMVKPAAQAAHDDLDPTPVSANPGAWSAFPSVGPSPVVGSGGGGGGGSTRKSPVSASSPNFSWPSPTKMSFSSVSSTAAAPFDDRVVQEDKAQRERDLERLYAAVMEHDEAGGSPRRAAAAPAKEDVPKLKSPRFLRALRSPASAGGKHAGPDPTDGRLPSVASVGSAGTGHGHGHGKRKTIRGLPISQPQPTPNFSLLSIRSGTGAPSDEEAPTPYYPPPSPPTSSTSPAPAPPPTAHRLHQYYSSSPPPPPSATRAASSSPTAWHGVGSAKIQVLAPVRAREIPALSVHTGPGRHHRTPASIPPAPVSPPPQLPLRSLNAMAMAGRSATAAAAAALDAAGLQPAPPAGSTKLTILERALPAHGHHANLSPHTAVPFTPYSPYMPATPITPITPGLVSRRQRKARDKMAGTRLAPEMVPADGELWSEGYGS
ncbi:MAG: hypothetical protein M1826_007057 [Phylliscum demangeonii]|nr:MAG: hypothetical protein M1826_007057 [Phylliscum demangeonii]